MRLLLDTNVFIAAFISRGVCHELLEHCSRTHEITASEFILSELEEKLIRKFRIPSPTVGNALGLLRSRIQVVDPEVIERVSRDPEDDPVLAAAVAGECRCLITGDKDLRVLQSYRNIPILAPAEFWSFEASQI